MTCTRQQAEQISPFLSSRRGTGSFSWGIPQGAALYSLLLTSPICPDNKTMTSCLSLQFSSVTANTSLFFRSTSFFSFLCQGWNHFRRVFTTQRPELSRQCALLQAPWERTEQQGWAVPFPDPELPPAMLCAPWGKPGVRSHGLGIFSYSPHYGQNINGARSGAGCRTTLLLLKNSGFSNGFRSAWNQNESTWISGEKETIQDPLCLQPWSWTQHSAVWHRSEPVPWTASSAELIQQCVLAT